MPSLSEQVRTARRRRRRTRRAVTCLAGAAAAAFVGAHVLTSTAASDGLPDVSNTGGPAPASSTTGPAATGPVPGLLEAFRRAQTAAAVAGQQLTITSGFRTAEEQAALLDAEVAERGSLEEALWWVFPPDRSMHVQGLAIDVGDGPAADWLAREGARFGLCRTLAWEWWHFEWRERWEAAAACPKPAHVPHDAPLP